MINPIAQIANTYNKSVVDKLSGNFGANYKFLENFSVESNIQFNYAEVRGENFNPVAFYGSGKVFNKDRSEYSESKSVFQDYTFDAILNYEKIFKIFKSVGNKERSTGIGLSIVKKKIDLYKGKVWLESEIGVGTTFFFTLKK